MTYREEKAITTILSMLAHHVKSGIRSLRLSGAETDVPHWRHLLDEFPDLERAAIDLVFSPRLRQLEISHFQSFPLQHFLSLCRSNVENLRIKNIRVANPSINRKLHSPSDDPMPRGLATSWRTLALDQTALKSLKPTGPESDATEIAFLGGVDGLCMINPDLSPPNDSDIRNWSRFLGMIG